MEKLSESVLRKLFAPNKSNPDLIHGRESKTIEYKQSYNHAGMAQYFKTMAAFANTEGGYIIFGIGDSPRNFIGLTDKSKDQFENIRIEEFTHNLNDYFQPEIRWNHTIFEYRNKAYGIIYTFPLKNKPCICSKVYDDSNKKYSLEEGDIYYRYSGQSQKIKYAELRDIILKTAEHEAQLWRKLIKNISRIGISNVSLLNLNNGEIGVESGMIVMDKELVDKIKFVKEGSFVEKQGSPALKLIGTIDNIKTTDGVLLTTPRLKAIEQEDIFVNFLMDNETEAPLEFIKVIMNCSSGFQPIYFYIKQSGREIQDAIDFIENSRRTTQTVKLLLERLRGRREVKLEPPKKESISSIHKMKYFNAWKDMKIDSIESELMEDKKRKWFFQSFFLLDDETLVRNSKYYKDSLLSLYKERSISSFRPIIGDFRKALCRLDEVLYFGKTE